MIACQNDCITHDIDEIVVHLHFFSKLAPDLLDGEFVVGVNKSIQPHNMELFRVLFGQI